jgi:hypothetical protein
MLRYDALVYDGFVTPGVTTYTGVQHAKDLALGDQMGLQAIVDFGAGGSFTAAIEHSGNGVDWVQKNTTPEINAAPITAGTFTSLYGGEAYPPKQSLELVRIRLDVTPPYTSGPPIVAPTRVRLRVVLRERGKGRYSSCGCGGGKAPAPSVRDEDRARLRERAQQLLASRPHASMAELEKRLLSLPMALEPEERLRRAVDMLEQRERLEVLGFLQRAAAAEQVAQQSTG